MQITRAPSTSRLELVLTQNTVLPASTPVSALSASGAFGLPVLAYVLLGFTAIATAIVQYTPLGLRLYAIGEFPDAARAAGLPLRRRRHRWHPLRFLSERQHDPLRLLSIVANGLLLTDLNFYWQQVGTGTLIFAVLALSFINRKAAGNA